MRIPKHPFFAGGRPHQTVRRVYACVLLCVSACALALALAACGDKDPVIIGFAGQLEGPYSDLGVQGRNGAMLAVEHANSDGGLDGRPFRLLAKHDGNSPENARQAIKDLHAAGAAIVVGHMTSSQSMASLPVAEELGLLLVSPTTSSPLFSNKKDPFFRVIPENTAWSRALARHCYTRDGVRSVVQITDMRNAAFAKLNNAAFSEAFTSLGGTISGRLAIPPDSTPSWDDLSDRVGRLAPEAIQVALASRDLAALVRRLRLKAPDIRIYSSMWGYTDELIEAGGGAVENIIFSVAYSGDNTSPNFVRFKSQYRNRFGRPPNFAAALGYEAASVAIHALRQGGNDPARQARAITDLHDFPGVIGNLDFDAFGDVKRPAFIVTVKDRAFVTITTIEDTP